MVPRSLFGGFVVVIAGLVAAAPAGATHQEGEVTLQVSKRVDSAPGQPLSGIGQVTGTGISCGADCSQTYTLGEDCQADPDGFGNHSGGNLQCDTIYPDVSLSAPAGTGYTFSGWSGACSGSGTCEPFVEDNPTTVTASFTDTGNPAVFLFIPTDGAYVRGVVGFQATASDNDQVSRVHFSVRGLIEATDTTDPYQANFDTTTVADGSASLVAIADDRSGNGSQSSRTVTIDNTLPSVSWNTSTEGEATNDSTPTFGYSGADANGPTFACAVDGGSYGLCQGFRKRLLRRGTGSFTTPPLADGPHTVYVRATDHAGNTATDAHAFTVDTVAPDTEITGGPQGRTRDRTPKFRFVAPGESGATFVCQLDDKPFENCASPHRYGKLRLGKHTFSVAAGDEAGNLDPAAAERKLKIVR